MGTVTIYVPAELEGFVARQPGRNLQFLHVLAKSDNLHPKNPSLSAGGAARLPDQELYQRLEQRHLPERPPRLLQARHDAQLGQAQPERWVSESSTVNRWQLLPGIII